MNQEFQANLLGVEEHLEKILSSEGFRNAGQRSRLLRFLVQNALTRPDTIKEHTIGVSVYDRDADYDPRIDPIVRVQVGRLRAALDKYYEGPGRGEPFRIEVPKGAYLPIFRTVQETPARDEEIVPEQPTGGSSHPPKRRLFSGKIGLITAMAAITIAIAAWYLKTVQRPISSVVVLPFQNLTGDPSNEFLSDGLTEILTTELANVPRLRVVARTSAYKFKGKGIDVRDVGRQLGVQAVVEGSLLSVTGGVQVTVHLDRSDNGYHLWGEHFATSTAADVSSRILAAIAPRLGSGTLRRTTVRPASEQAYTEYLLGRYFWNRRTTADVNKSIEHFRNALRADGAYAQAYAGLADSYIVLADNDQTDPNPAFREARAAAQKAIQLDPSLSEPHASLAQTAFHHDWNWTEAEAEFQRALALNPDYATARHWYALCLTWRGRFADADFQIGKAHEIDPLSPVIAGTAGVVKYFARDYDGTLKAAKSTLDLNPNNYFPHYLSGLAWERKAQYGPALAEFEKAFRLAPQESETTMRLAHCLSASGDRRRAEELLETMLHPRAGMRVSPYQIAVVNAGLGDKEDAIAWLDKAWRERDPDIVMLRVDPYFDAIREDPRVKRLIVP